MKVLPTLLATALLPLSVTACNSQTEASEPAKKPAAPQTEEVAKPAVDKATEVKETTTDATAIKAPAEGQATKPEAAPTKTKQETTPATSEPKADLKKPKTTGDTQEKPCDVTEDIAAIEASLERLQKSIGQASEKSTKLAAAEKANQTMALQMAEMSQKLQAEQKSALMVQQLTAKSDETSKELEALRKENAKLKSDCKSAHAAVHELRKKVDALVNSFNGTPAKVETK